MQKKAKGLFGGDKYNAPGGKLQEGEDPKDGVVRETKEETGLTISNFKKYGTLYFYEKSKEELSWLVHVFMATEFSGDLKHDYREGTLEWVAQGQIPYDKMWEDDQYWVPLLLDQKQFTAHFYFEDDFKKLLSKEIFLLPEIEKSN